ncbi:MAG TPA: FkbM family methyltransferase [Saprospiraceae bacterium]|nr:FkbM family methyltransferase [Saprospiraceae bacterium]
MNFIKKIRIQLVQFLIELNERVFFVQKQKRVYRKLFAGKMNCVIDVGANKGQSIDIFTSVNPECKIYAMEPNPELYQFLRKKYAKQQNIKIFNKGISNISGQKIFYENIFNGSSTLEELNNDSKYLEKKASIFGVPKEEIHFDIYPVQVETLSEFIKSHKIKDIDLIKIDTEGHEYHCLGGLFNNENNVNINYIQIEYHDHDMYINRVPFTSIVELLYQNHFVEYARIKHGFGEFYDIIFKNNYNTRK